MNAPIRRRDFITLLGGAAAAWPCAARAQQTSMPVVGFLHPATAIGYAPYVAAMRQGLSETGFNEGRNYAIDFRWGEDDIDRLPSLATELVQRRVAVIVAGGSGAAIVAKAATTTIPIVFSSGNDPVKAGLVASFNRPGGNATGTVQFNNELLTKRFDLMRDLLPHATIIGLLVDTTSMERDARVASLQTAASSVGQQIRLFNVARREDFDGAFAAMRRDRVEGVLVPNTTLFTNGREVLVAAAARHRIPASYEYREFVTAGGLMSYGSSNADSYRMVGTYVGRILKGEKPSQMPVVQPTRFEFVLNLRAAKALGLDIPLKLHAFADEVIE
jgi:putative tryptophan/tyrosine transport system substrate-binding protein